MLKPRVGRLEAQIALMQVGTFIPTPLSIGCVLWLRADQGFSGGFWADQSGQANNALQASAPAQPTLITSAVLGNQAAVRFNGATQFMTLTRLIECGGNYLPVDGVPNTASVAAVFNSNAQGNFFATVYSNFGFRLLNSTAPAGDWAYFSQQSGNGTVSVLGTATPYALVATQITPTNIPTWTNGALVTLTEPVAGVDVAACTIGANDSGVNQFGQIDLAELIVNITPWTTAQVTLLRAYFTQRYGFAA